MSEGMTKTARDLHREVPGGVRRVSRRQGGEGGYFALHCPDAVTLLETRERFIAHRPLHVGGAQLHRLARLRAFHHLPAGGFDGANPGAAYDGASEEREVLEGEGRRASGVVRYMGNAHMERAQQQSSNGIKSHSAVRPVPAAFENRPD